ncbi:MAG: hypothetical protein ACRD2N_11630 [Vicinamibacterales bacterium]
MARAQHSADFDEGGANFKPWRAAPRQIPHGPRHPSPGSQAQTELTALQLNWGERVGVKQHVFAPAPPPTPGAAANPGAGHVLRMNPVPQPPARL